MYFGPTWIQLYDTQCSHSILNWSYQMSTIYTDVHKTIQTLGEIYQEHGLIFNANFNLPLLDALEKLYALKRFHNKKPISKVFEFSMCSMNWLK
jgi:hypothetical protein